MLTDLTTILTKYKKEGTAVGAFNTPNSATIRAVISAAEELNVPVIISHAQLHESVAPLDFIGPIMIECAKRAKIPVCVHLDHGEDFLYVKCAIDLGFTSVMIDASTSSLDENKILTKKVTDYAKKYNVSVEAELGKLMRNEVGADNGATESDYTNPETVANFVKETNIDVLAIAFGTAHGIYDKPPVLNFDIISQCKEKTACPLVMHGGSGISANDYREVIKRGISKINYYTYMSYDGFEAVKKVTDKKTKGFYHDLAEEAYRAMKENVLKTLKVFSNIK
jgi:fructose-bisphosphate aldolase class II